MTPKAIIRLTNLFDESWDTFSYLKNLCQSRQKEIPDLKKETILSTAVYELQRLDKEKYEKEKNSLNYDLSRRKFIKWALVVEFLNEFSVEELCYSCPLCKADTLACGCLSEEEIDRKIKEAQAIKFAPIDWSKAAGPSSLPVLRPNNGIPVFTHIGIVGFTK